MWLVKFEAYTVHPGLSESRLSDTLIIQTQNFKKNIELVFMSPVTWNHIHLILSTSFNIVSYYLQFLNAIFVTASCSISLVSHNETKVQNYLIIFLCIYELHNYEGWTNTYYLKHLMFCRLAFIKLYNSTMCIYRDTQVVSD